MIHTGISAVLPTSACTDDDEMRRGGMLVRYAGDLPVTSQTPDSRLMTRLLGIDCSWRPSDESQSRQDPDAPAHRREACAREDLVSRSQVLSLELVAKLRKATCCCTPA
jgi:hypothetical protein